MTMLRRDCRWHMYYAGGNFCKLPALRGVRTPPLPLQNGCPENCPDLLSVSWKRDLYPDDYPDEVPGEMDGKDSE